MKKKKGKGFLIAGALFFLIYFITFSPSFSPDRIWEPVWKIPVQSFPQNNQTAAFDLKAIHPFKLGRLFGFFTESGKLLYSEFKYYETITSSQSFINFSAHSESFLLQKFNGEIIQSFHAFGYPVLSADGKRIFIVKYDQTGIQELDLEAKMLWSREFASMITTLSVSETAVLIGLLSGRLLMINPTGTVISEVTPAENSAYQTVYGAACSPHFICGVAGLDPQVFFYARKKESGNPKINTLEIKENIRREIPVIISSSERFFYFPGLSVVNMFAVETNDMRLLNFQGNLVDIREQYDWGLVLVISRDAQNSYLQIFRLNGQLYYSETFAQEIRIQAVSSESVFLSIASPARPESWLEGAETALIRYDFKEGK